MNDLLVEVWFLDNNTRKNPPYGTVYRPHFVIENTNEYLGIQFENLEKRKFNEYILCDIILLYEGVDYSKLKKGASFEIKEGPYTVGKGFVIR